MAVTRYQPTTDLFRPLEEFLTPFARVASSMRTPETDVVEREDEIEVVTELPGMRAEDIEVSLESNLLTISGEKSEERTEGGAKDTYHLSERRWGRFSRSFVLPREVESDNIRAQYRDGVLSVRIPKSDKAKPRRIDVQGDGGTREVGTESSGGT